MALEIERKYLVINDTFRQMAHESRHIVQGYLSRDVDATVRVRLIDNQGFLTIKSRNHGAVRSEWEYPIPGDDARQLLALCRGSRIAKTRWMVDYEGYRWEVDVFEGEHSGLTVAEVELRNADEQPSLPPFVGAEVTGAPRYYNSSL